MKTNEKVFCACGCGETTDKYDSRGRIRKYIHGHWSRIQPNDKLVVSCSNCGKEFLRPQWHVKRVSLNFCGHTCEGMYSTVTGRRSGQNNGHYNTIEQPCHGCGCTVRKAESLIRRRNNRVYCESCCVKFLRVGRPGFYVGYPKAFSASLRHSVRKRDAFTCQYCGAKQSDVKTLHVHHIDYDKENNSLVNLVSLCAKCHGQTNYSPDTWKAVFTSSPLRS